MRWGVGVVWVAIWFAQPASAKEPTEGVPLVVRVLDSAGDPVPAAVVRHLDEGERHPVNSATGEHQWQNNRLLLPTGEKVYFAKGMAIALEVSAPGYRTTPGSIVLRKKKNLVVVQLEAVDFGLDQAVDLEDPTLIELDRDKPID